MDMSELSWISIYLENTVNQILFRHGKEYNFMAELQSLTQILFSGHSLYSFGQVSQTLLALVSTQITPFPKHLK